MATNEEIIKTLKDNLADGIAESQFADRRERKLTPKEIAEGLRALRDEYSSQGSPFIRVAFTGRHV
jgi:hypothetical protein